MTNARQYILELVLAFLIAVLAMYVLRVTGACAGEMIDCAESPGRGNWVYRVIDDRRCWFRADGLRRGREKPREELRWPIDASPPPMIVTDPDPRAPWEFEYRWKGE
jgi:hypothetical protein